MIAPAVPPLADLLGMFQEGLWLPDPGVVTVTLAAIAANRLPGDPTWLLLVGPPSSGKSEALHAVSNLPECHNVDSLTEAGLLSGTLSRSGSGTGGVLREMGDRGVLMASDMSTMLPGSSEARTATFSALRRVYDGFYVRRLGTNGGLTVAWEGHAGFLGAVTEAIDAPDVSLGLLGERFSYYRLPRATVDDDLFACSLANELAGHETDLRAERAAAVAGFFADLPIPNELPGITEPEHDRLSTLATIGARLRSPTVRDGRTRELVVVPQSERPMRLLRQLRHLHAGLVTIGCSESETWRLLGEVALGATHPARRAIVEFLLGEERRSFSTADIAGACRIPRTPAARHLEDLHAHGVLDLLDGIPRMWSASGWLRDAWWAVDGTEPGPMTDAGIVAAAPAPALAWTEQGAF